MKYGEALNRIVRALRVPQVRASFRLSPTAFALMIQPMSALAQDAAGNASLPRDLTPWGMFMNADEVVREKRAMNLEMLDGFFAALICGPDDVPPSEYLSEIWGGDMVNEATFQTKPILQE